MSPIVQTPPPKGRSRGTALALVLVLAAPVAVLATSSQASAAPSAKHCSTQIRAAASAQRGLAGAQRTLKRVSRTVAVKRAVLRKAKRKQWRAARKATAQRKLSVALTRQVRAARAVTTAQRAQHVADRALETCGLSEAKLPLVSPLEGGVHGKIGNSTSVDLVSAGYTETEHLLSGTAQSFRRVGTWDATGTWNTRDLATAPFATRMIVRAPQNKTRFSGTVVVEWLNVSGGVDVDVDWAYTHREIIRKGHAWVGVSAQQAGIDTPAGTSALGPTVSGLKAWDPIRYSALDHPGDEFSYDIFTQAGRAILRSRGADVLPGMKVRQLLAVGQSQSGMRMATYANAIQRSANVYDGILVHSRAGTVAPLAGATPAPAHIRTDLNVPVLQLVTETELFTLAGPDPKNTFHASRQDDSVSVRTWEMAGGAHSDEALLRVLHPQYVAQFGPTVNPLDRLFGMINNAPQDAVTSAALNALSRWAATGTAPASATPIVTVDGDIVRDLHGNALGGVRTPALDVPIARHTGENERIATNGAIELFDATKLAALYPTHEAYVSAFTEAANRAVAGGWLVAEDAAAMIATAEASAIGTLQP